MKRVTEKPEWLLGLGGIKKDIAFLVISGAAVICSLLKFKPFPFDMAWIAIILCGLPIVLEAVIGLVTAFDIKADVLVSMALIASICIGEIFAAGEIAFIMQLGALLEELTVARAQPRSRQRRLTSIAGKPQDKNKNTHESCECRDKFNFVGLPISIKLQKPTAMGNRSGRFLYSLLSENLFCLFALKGFCNLPEQLAYGQVLRARVLALSAADAVRCFAVILGVDLIVAVRVPVAAELLCVHA